MKTDLPLKRLTQLCPTDLLALFGIPHTTVLRVEALELPTSTRSLDCLLHLRAPDGTTYLQVIEWQGWTDPSLLWRSLGYLSWLGQHRTERPILLTIIYLKPGDDVGDALVQQLPGQPGWQVQLPCVRLWEQDAQQAVASGLPGLLALSPLMGGATAALVETAAQQLLRITQPPVQGDLLIALGVFAEPLFSAKRFLQLITKERLMSSDLFTLVYEDKLAEMEQERQAWQEQMAKRDAERDAEQAQWRTAMQQSVEHVLISRFPDAPSEMIRVVRQVQDAPRLQELLNTILAGDNLAAIEQAIMAASA